LRVWYCEVAIYKGWNFSSRSPLQLRLWCCNNWRCCTQELEHYFMVPWRIVSLYTVVLR